MKGYHPYSSCFFSTLMTWNNVKSADWIVDFLFFLSCCILSVITLDYFCIWLVFDAMLKNISFLWLRPAIWWEETKQCPGKTPAHQHVADRPSNLQPVRNHCYIQSSVYLKTVVYFNKSKLLGLSKNDSILK